MSTALERAAKQLAPQLETFNIKVEGYAITWRGRTETVEFGTPKTKCLPLLRGYLRKAREAEDFKNEKRTPLL